MSQKNEVKHGKPPNNNGIIQDHLILRGVAMFDLIFLGRSITKMESFCAD